MSDAPIHPLIVHFPLVLAVFLPLAVLTALLAGRLAPNGRKYWAGILALQLALSASAFVATQTGNREEEKVEDVLASEGPLETHEESGELFFKASLGVLAAAAVGLAPGLPGLAARGLTGLGAVLLLALGIQAGHTGGDLVYKHGAAAAYASASPAGAGSEGGKAAGGIGEAGEAGEAGEKTGAGPESGADGKGGAEADDDDD